MSKKSENYEAGKRGERECFVYLQNLGYHCPNDRQRKNLALAYLERGIELKKRGFDCVELKWLAALNDLEKLRSVLDSICLFEVKASGAKRRASVSPGFVGFGFTLTGSELSNARALGRNFRFLLVNSQTQSQTSVALEDFFNEEFSRIYPTYSIFIRKDIGPSS